MNALVASSSLAAKVRRSSFKPAGRKGAVRGAPGMDLAAAVAAAKATASLLNRGRGGSSQPDGSAVDPKVLADRDPSQRQEPLGALRYGDTLSLRSLEHGVVLGAIQDPQFSTPNICGLQPGSAVSAEAFSLIAVFEVCPVVEDTGDRAKQLAGEREKRGQPVRYFNSRMRLRHQGSGRYLAVDPESPSLNNHRFQRAMLVAGEDEQGGGDEQGVSVISNRANAVAVIVPKFKNLKKENDAVSGGDEMLLMFGDSFLCVTARDSDDVYQVDGAREEKAFGVGLRITLFRSFRKDLTSAVSIGDVITLYHPEAEGSLSAAHGARKDEILCVEPGENEWGNCNSLFMVLGPDPLRYELGGDLQPKDFFRLLHVASGQLLSVERPETAQRGESSDGSKRIYFVSPGVVKSTAACLLTANEAVRDGDGHVSFGEIFRLEIGESKHAANGYGICIQKGMVVTLDVDDEGFKAREAPEEALAAGDRQAAPKLVSALPSDGSSSIDQVFKFEKAPLAHVGTVLYVDSMRQHLDEFQFMLEEEANVGNGNDYLRGMSNTEFSAFRAAFQRLVNFCTEDTPGDDVSTGIFAREQLPNPRHQELLLSQGVVQEVRETIQCIYEHAPDTIATGVDGKVSMARELLDFCWEMLRRCARGYPEAGEFIVQSFLSLVLKHNAIDVLVEVFSKNQKANQAVAQNAEQINQLIDYAFKGLADSAEESRVNRHKYVGFLASLCWSGEGASHSQQTEKDDDIAADHKIRVAVVGQLVRQRQLLCLAEVVEDAGGYQHRSDSAKCSVRIGIGGDSVVLQSCKLDADSDSANWFSGGDNVSSLVRMHLACVELVRNACCTETRESLRSLVSSQVILNALSNDEIHNHLRRAYSDLLFELYIDEPPQLRADKVLADHALPRAAQALIRVSTSDGESGPVLAAAWHDCLGILSSKGGQSCPGFLSKGKDHEDERFLFSLLRCVHRLFLLNELPGERQAAQEYHDMLVRLLRHMTDVTGALVAPVDALAMAETSAQERSAQVLENMSHYKRKACIEVLHSMLSMANYQISFKIDVFFDRYAVGNQLEATGPLKGQTFEQVYRGVRRIPVKQVEGDTSLRDELLRLFICRQDDLSTVCIRVLERIYSERLHLLSALEDAIVLETSEQLETFSNVSDHSCTVLREGWAAFCKEAISEGKSEVLRNRELGIRSVSIIGHLRQLKSPKFSQFQKLHQDALRHQRVHTHCIRYIDSVLAVQPTEANEVVLSAVLSFLAAFCWHHPTNCELLKRKLTRIARVSQQCKAFPRARRCADYLLLCIVESMRNFQLSEADDLLDHFKVLGKQKSIGALRWMQIVAVRDRETRARVLEFLLESQDVLDGLYQQQGNSDMFVSTSPGEIDLQRLKDAVDSGDLEKEDSSLCYHIELLHLLAECAAGDPNSKVMLGSMRHLFPFPNCAEIVVAEDMPAILKDAYLHVFTSVYILPVRADPTFGSFLLRHTEKLRQFLNGLVSMLQVDQTMSRTSSAGKQWQMYGELFADARCRRKAYVDTFETASTRASGARSAALELDSSQPVMPPTESVISCLSLIYEVNLFQILEDRARLQSVNDKSDLLAMFRQDICEADVANALRNMIETAVIALEDQQLRTADAETAAGDMPPRPATHDAPAPCVVSKLQRFANALHYTTCFDVDDSAPVLRREATDPDTDDVQNSEHQELSEQLEKCLASSAVKTTDLVSSFQSFVQVLRHVWGATSDASSRTACLTKLGDDVVLLDWWDAIGDDVSAVPVEFRLRRELSDIILTGVNESDTTIIEETESLEAADRKDLSPRNSDRAVGPADAEEAATLIVAGSGVGARGSEITVRNSADPFHSADTPSAERRSISIFECERITQAIFHMLETVGKDGVGTENMFAALTGALKRSAHTDEELESADADESEQTGRVSCLVNLVGGAVRATTELALGDLSGDSWDRNDDADAPSEIVQNRIAEYGACKLIPQFLDFPDEAVALGALDLGVLVLEGGQQKVQDEFWKMQKEDLEGDFDSDFLDAIVKTIREKICSRNEGTFARDSVFAMKILRFLQLLCEGHNRQWQNMLRYQGITRRNVDVVAEVTQLFGRHTSDVVGKLPSVTTLMRLPGTDPRIHSTNAGIDLLTQFCNTLCEFCQGPIVESARDCLTNKILTPVVELAEWSFARQKQILQEESDASGSDEMLGMLGMGGLSKSAKDLTSKLGAPLGSDGQSNESSAQLERQKEQLVDLEISLVELLLALVEGNDPSNVNSVQQDLAKKDFKGLRSIMMPMMWHGRELLGELRPRGGIMAAANMAKSAAKAAQGSLGDITQLGSLIEEDPVLFADNEDRGCELVALQYSFISTISDTSTELGVSVAQQYKDFMFDADEKADSVWNPFDALGAVRGAAGGALKITSGLGAGKNALELDQLLDVNKALDGSKAAASAAASNAMGMTKGLTKGALSLGKYALKNIGVDTGSEYSAKDVRAELRRVVQKIEIQRDGNLEVVFFPVPRRVFELKSAFLDKYRSDLENNLVRTNSRARVTDLLKKMEHFLEAMRHQNWISSSFVLKTVQGVGEKVVYWAIYCTVFINMLVIVCYDGRASQYLDGKPFQTPQRPELAKFGNAVEDNKLWGGDEMNVMCVYPGELLFVAMIVHLVMSAFKFVLFFLEHPLLNFKLEMKKQRVKLANGQDVSKLDVIGGDPALRKERFKAVASSLHALMTPHGGFVFHFLHTALSVIAFLTNNAFFYSLHMIELFQVVALLNVVLVAISRNGRSLLSVFLGFATLIFLSAVIGWVVFLDPSNPYYIHYGFDDEPGWENSHPSFRAWFFMHLDLGLRDGPRHQEGEGDGLGHVWGVLNDNKGGSTQGRVGWAFRLFAILYYLLIVLVGGSVISGIIIDAFAAMRDANKAVKDDKENTDFVSGLHRSQFEQRSVNFDTWRKEFHDPWNYIYCAMYLEQKPETEFTGQETYLMEMFGKKDTKLFPINRASVIPNDVLDESGGAGAMISSANAGQHDDSAGAQQRRAGGAKSFESFVKESRKRDAEMQNALESLKDMVESLAQERLTVAVDNDDDEDDDDDS